MSTAALSTSGPATFISSRPRLSAICPSVISLPARASTAVRRSAWSSAETFWSRPRQ
ncbi:hypothetical protein ACFQHO_36010 [Actinomadura yumaensis]|uniref:hypothetical protein n=1 Tax=Actinomadura yumaensis TaxID=111807 RepID=UPI00362378FE